MLSAATEADRSAGSGSNVEANSQAVVNYPPAEDRWASGFTENSSLLKTCLKTGSRVRSLTFSPPVYSLVPNEVFMSFTDTTNMHNMFQKCNILKQKFLKDIRFHPIG